MGLWGGTPWGDVKVPSSTPLWRSPPNGARGVLNLHPKPLAVQQEAGAQVNPDLGFVT